MPRKQKLKVYRTPIGFHDAYVAAPSQKAALAAWGSDSNLFAQALAEEVTDPELMAEPLQSPGQVFRKLRGTEREQVEALGSTPAKKAIKRASKPLKPKPSRASLTTAEEDLRSTETRQARKIKSLKSELEAVEKKLRGMEHTHTIELQKAKQRCEDEAERYERAVRRWADS